MVLFSALLPPPSGSRPPTPKRVARLAPPVLSPQREGEEPSTEPGSRAIVADSLPPGTALLILLFQMEGLVAAVEARRLRRRAGEELIREAQAHRSAPEREMDDCLDATRLLLLSKGFVPRGLRGPLAPEEIGDRRARMAPDPPGRDVRRARIAASDRKSVV